LQEALLRSPAVGRAVRDRLAELGVDLAVYDTLRCGQHADMDAKTHQVCYLDDLHSQRYWLMLDTMRRFPDVDMQALGTFAEQVPAAIRPLAQSRRAQRVLLSIEYRLTRRSEVRAARRFASNLLVNEDEAVLLRSRAGVPADRVYAVPPVVREPWDVERTWDGAPEFVFLGMLTQAHNEDGIRSFLVHTWPEMLHRRPDAVLRLIGRPPRAAVREIAARHGDSVVLEGFVPDLDGLLARAAALVNPLRFGSGVKIKVIEALGRGLPVVSSRVGADGIESGPDSGILIGDGVTDTVEAMLTLVDPAQNRAASAAAKAHFHRRYTRSAAFACYDRAFGLVP
jgi:glycosyltransferase involved in cell wall biosynthesis